MSTESLPRSPMVGLLGGECTGKTTLAEALTVRFPGAVVAPEELRAFVSRQGRSPEPHEQPDLMGLQRAAEDAAQGASLVISDPATLMTAVYSIVYFGDESLLVQAAADLPRYDLLLWCGTDLPWRADGAQRDGPERRAQADRVIAEVLAELGAHAVRLDGPLADRIALAAETIAETITETITDRLPEGVWLPRAPRTQT